MQMFMLKFTRKGHAMLYFPNTLNPATFFCPPDHLTGLETSGFQYANVYVEIHKGHAMLYFPNTLNPGTFFVPQTILQD